MASSPYVKLDDALFPNTLAYYVEGNQDTATKLTLTLRVDQLEREGEAITRYEKACQMLYERALGQTMPTNLIKAIRTGKCYEKTSSNRKLFMERHFFDNSPTKSYHIQLIIEVV